MRRETRQLSLAGRGGAPLRAAIAKNPDRHTKDLVPVVADSCVRPTRTPASGTVWFTPHPPRFPLERRSLSASPLRRCPAPLPRRSGPVRRRPRVQSAAGRNRRDGDRRGGPCGPARRGVNAGAIPGQPGGAKAGHGDGRLLGRGSRLEDQGLVISPVSGSMVAVVAWFCSALSRATERRRPADCLSR